MSATGKTRNALVQVRFDRQRWNKPTVVGHTRDVADRHLVAGACSEDHTLHDRGQPAHRLGLERLGERQRCTPKDTTHETEEASEKLPERHGLRPELDRSTRA